MRWLLILSALSYVGCATGAASLVLRSPVEEKCRDLKLKSCDKLADGVVLYVDGDKSQGYAQLKSGIAVNSDEPLKLKALASGLKLLQKAPGVGPYVATLQPVIELVDDAATEALQRKRSSDEEPDTGATVAKDATELPQPTGLPIRGGSVGAARTGTATATQKGAAPCSLLVAAPGMLAGSAMATCTLILDGPLVVTDIHGGACPQERFVFSGESERPRWFIHVPAATPISIHGASLAVQSGAPLHVATLANADAAQSQSATCAITWSARRPPQQ